MTDKVTAIAVPLPDLTISEMREFPGVDWSTICAKAIVKHIETLRDFEEDLGPYVTPRKTTNSK